jgi:hypothetical protein
VLHLALPSSLVEVGHDEELRQEVLAAVE